MHIKELEASNSLLMEFECNSYKGGESVSVVVEGSVKRVTKLSANNGAVETTVRCGMHLSMVAMDLYGAAERRFVCMSLSHSC